MRYRSFGKTGIKISVLGFGCMRLPMVECGGKEVVDEDRTIEMIRYAYEHGVNYYDTAYMYCGGYSEIALGKALKGIRDKVYVSTKCPGDRVEKPGDYRRILEEQLRKLDMEYIDFYHFHGIGYNSFLETDRRGQWLKDALKAREDGIIKHISFSFHDEAANMIKLVDMDIFESVLCQYNAIDRSNEDAIRYAASKGLGVVVMGPLGGGRVSGLPKSVASKLGIKVKSSAELALRFVLSNPYVDCAISGMENIRMVEENIATASNESPLSEEEIKAINDMMAENHKLSQLYCTGCAYCMPCPSEVNIPHIFQMMNYYRVYRIVDYARNGYKEIGTTPWVKGKRADACIECGVCETKCPQKIKIREQLKESHKALSTL